MKTVTESRDLNCKERSRRGSYQTCFRSGEHFKGKHSLRAQSLSPLQPLGFHQRGRGGGAGRWRRRDVPGAVIPAPPPCLGLRPQGCNQW